MSGKMEPRMEQVKECIQIQVKVQEDYTVKVYGNLLIKAILGSN